MKYHKRLDEDTEARMMRFMEGDDIEWTPKVRLTIIAGLWALITKKPDMPKTVLDSILNCIGSTAMDTDEELDKYKDMMRQACWVMFDNEHTLPKDSVESDDIW